MANGCKKIEFTDGFTKEAADLAHQNDLICNVSGIDTQEETHKFLAMGADTIMTGNCLMIKKAITKKM